VAKKQGTKPAAPKKRLMDVDAASLKDACRVFRISEITLYKWVEKGCPRKEDGTFIIYDIYHWLIDKGAKGKLKEQKMQAEIDRIHAQTEKINEKYILREDHEHITNSWASSFKKFWMQAVKRNIIHFCNKDLDQLNVLFDGFGRQMANTWADAWTEK